MCLDTLHKIPKSFPPNLFTMSADSGLFNQITWLPKYYPARVEVDILVELGSGTSEKTKLLLGALRDHGSLHRFVLFDVDASMLSVTATAIQHEYSGVEIKAFCGEFEEHIAKISAAGRRWFVF
nr:L-histidine N(alpha)-methyltransferase [Mycobacterium uberis]